MLANVSNLLVASLFAVAAVGSNIHRGGNSSYGGDEVDAISAEGLAKLKEWTRSNPPTGNCTLENAAIRREWYEPAHIRGIPLTRSANPLGLPSLAKNVLTISMLCFVSRNYLPPRRLVSSPAFAAATMISSEPT